MIEAIYEIEQSGNDLKEIVGNMLGQEEKITDAFISKMRIDDDFASLVFRVAKHPDLIHLLFDETGSGGHSAENFSNLDLIKSSTRSLAKWGVNGFQTLDKEQLETRMSICSSCPNLIEAPDRALYKIKLSKDADMRTCALCGCVAARKARLTSETCPAGKW